MSASPIDGLYWDQHWPLSLKQLLDQVLGRQRNSPNTPVAQPPPAVRQWFSQPRASSDDTTEVLSINFRLPLSVSEISFEAQRVPVRIEVWYLDRLNNWRQVLDSNRIPVSVTLVSSSQESWYKHHVNIFPIVAKSVQLRATRVRDPAMGTEPYMIGIRNTLLRRNVYDRSAGRLPFEDELDPLGNVVARYIKDWDASKAIDDKPLTYWRSAPQPDHQAVCSLYLDTRNADGSPQLIDTVYLDPVYTGQTLNLYYSNDETVGTRRLSAITLPAEEDVNTEWRSGVGRWDISTAPVGTSSYAFDLAIGPLVRQDCWFGMEWYPDFDPTAGPVNNPVLLGVTPADPEPGQWWPTISYDVGAAALVLQFTDGTDFKTYQVPTSPLFVPGEPLRIVVGWRYDPNTVLISVRDRTGTEIARLEDDDPGLPEAITIDGRVGFANFRGRFTSHIIKLEDFASGAEAYQANPTVYVSPEPVLPDRGEQTPSTSLDNAVYAADWTLQSHGSGGSHDSFYENKTWTPIWRDYITSRGNLYLPQSISMRYLKLEFTNLTEEPYPVYDAGIQTTYKVFPMEVQQLATRKHPGLLGVGLGMLQLGVESALGLVGIGSVNWLNPNSVSRAVDNIFGVTVHPVTVTTGAPMSFSTLPTTMASTIVDTTRTEEANPYIYRRDSPDAGALAGQTLLGLADEWIQAISYSSGVIADAIFDSFTPLVNFIQNPAAGAPVQGKDWWIFPGGLLALPTVIMNGLTALTQVVLGRKPTIETRMRFMTTSVHRYDTRTVTRDAALAYFAGVREVRALSTAHIDEQDPPTFDFGVYDPNRWVHNNIRQLDTGPITTAGKIYQIQNPGFDTSLAHWQFDPDQGWVRDPIKGRWHWGSLKVSADGTEKNIRSSIIRVTEGEAIKFSCWVAWEDLACADDRAALVLGGTTYGDGQAIADIVFDEVSYPDWEDNASTGDSWVRLTGTWVAPAGVDELRVRLSVTEDATAGDAWFDTINIESDEDVMGTVYKEFATTSTFAKVRCEFRDSGLVRSDAMWARDDPDNTNIDNLRLAYYVSTIPDIVPSGSWGDTFATWADQTITWGSPHALVAINVDPNRIFDGRRVLRFSRAPGAGGAGIKIIQQTNYVPGALVRPCVVFYKPYANANQITLRIRRVSDGVYIHEETITTPAVGRWYTHQGQFIEVPEGPDQVYSLELTTTGDAEDELFVTDLYSELAHIRYFMRLGGPAEFLHDVTPLRYAEGAQVTTTEPVHEVSVQAAILSPKAFAYGCDIMPLYLK